MDAPLNRHGSEKFDQLFEQNTAEPGSLGEIVDKHAGDAVFFLDDDEGVRGADGGIGDFIPEMNSSNEDDGWDISGDDDDDGLSDEAVSTVDITGTAQGVARGFGSHLPIDLGAGGFQIKQMPDRMLPKNTPNAPGPGEELDDYDEPSA